MVLLFQWSLSCRVLTVVEVGNSLHRIHVTCFMGIRGWLFKHAFPQVTSLLCWRLCLQLRPWASRTAAHRDFVNVSSGPIALLRIFQIPNPLRTQCSPSLERFWASADLEYFIPEVFGPGNELQVYSSGCVLRKNCSTLFPEAARPCDLEDTREILQTNVVGYTTPEN